MIWLLLAFAVYPTALHVDGAPGDLVDMTLTLVGDEDVRIIGSGILHAEEQHQIQGKIQTTITGRISAHATPGTHTEYLYIAPNTDAVVVPATAIPVTTTVHPRDTSNRMLPGTRNVLRKSKTPLIAAALGVLTLGGGVLWRRRTARNSPKAPRHTHGDPDV